MKILALLLSLVICWEVVEQEIFELQQQLQEHRPKANFYSFLEIEQDATEKDITKAYRKLSLTLHPDKSQEKDAEKVYKVLTSIQAVLRNKVKRPIYDKYLKNGFPVWRGNNYFYQRYEPGIFMVLVLLLVFISIAQYITLVIFWFRDKQAPPPQPKEPETVLTWNQLKKKMNSSDEASPKISKREFKKGKKDILIKEEVSIIEPPFPSIFDVLLFSLPLAIVGKFLPSKTAKSPKSQE